MSYTKTSKRSLIPTIENATSFADKCAAFKSTLFPTPPREEPLPKRWEGYSSSQWKWGPLDQDELARACSSSQIKGKTPGPDRITQEIISRAYRAIPSSFYKVYSQLIDKGYHPKCWRQAIGVVLAKPGKPDYSKPKAYRIISLLNCLGKVSKRILARRLGNLADSNPDLLLLHPTQIGGRKRKSAIDTAFLLANYIEENKLKKKTTTALFLDVKGAFDHVAKNRLLRALIKQRLPQSLVRWTCSFLEERQL